MNKNKEKRRLQAIDTCKKLVIRFCDSESKSIEDEESIKKIIEKRIQYVKLLSDYENYDKVWKKNLKRCETSSLLKELILLQDILHIIRLSVPRSEYDIAYKDTVAHDCFLVLNKYTYKILKELKKREYFKW